MFACIEELRQFSQIALVGSYTRQIYCNRLGDRDCCRYFL